MENLQKSDTLSTYLELVGTGSDLPVIMHGLDCVSELFSMVSDEQSNPVRGDLKSVEKDTKILTEWFTKRRGFIKIHMVYRKFTEESREKEHKYPGVYPGRAFNALAEFYFTLNNEPECQKLKKDSLKGADYKEGIQHIVSMFGQREHLQPQQLSPREEFSSPNRLGRSNSKPLIVQAKKDKKEKSSTLKRLRSLARPSKE
jgi:hypothetical protein